MLRIKSLIIVGCVVSYLCSPTQGQESPLGPIVRWGAELSKTEQPASDSLKKLSTEIAEFKNRLQLLEENQLKHNTTLKSNLQAMQDTLNSLHARCERLNQDVVAGKISSSVTQAGANIPVVKKPIEDGVGNKNEISGQDLIIKRLDEITVNQQEISKLILQVQTNSRDIADIRKKYDALQLEFIQAQNDIGKLQQDFVRMNTRLDGSRIQPDNSADRNRQSLALPLPPDSQSSASIRSTQGVLKFVNSYPLTVSVVVDGQFYTLRSGDSLSLTRNPGYVTYEVVGIQGNTLRTVNAAETLTVQIVPR